MPSSHTLSSITEPVAGLAPPSLPELLATITDHRKPRGVRHRLDVLLAVALAAVVTGKKSYTAIAQWVGDETNTAIADLGVDLDRRPSEATLRRALSSVDADLLDRVLGAWMSTTTGTVEGRRVIAIDGKTVRGARNHADPTSRAPHLLAALCHSTGTFLGGAQIGTKSNEIPALRDLLDLFDLRDVVVTADALHCQRDTASHVLAAGGHYLFTVKSNQKALFTWAKSFTWANIPTNTVIDTGHGRRITRGVKALQLDESDTSFPGARQVVQVRRTRTQYVKNKQGVKHPQRSVEIVYLLCSLNHIDAPVQKIAEWGQSHWHIENRLHWVRDVIFDEDRCQIRTGAGPRVMATLRSMAISLLRLVGETCIAEATRAHAMHPGRPTSLVRAIHQRL
ncbi:ISAs1 family transposase [Corynebacterium glyciniphilum]|uniref:ISAs1 family transposase n=1 Tax=Corynebacterium glyciniphilum TaxID=1404244 RepID=UPI003DA0AD76